MQILTFGNMQLDADAVCQLDKTDFKKRFKGVLPNWEAAYKQVQKSGKKPSTNNWGKDK